MIRVDRFWTDYRPEADGSMKAIDMVEFHSIGDDKTTAVHRVKDILPPKHPEMKNPSHQAMMARWEVLGPAYDAWKRDEELPEEGTPLAAWSALSPEQVRVLKSLDIRTVEEVSQIGDSVTEKLRFPNARKLPELAKSFLSGTAVAAKDKEISDLKEQMAAMQELLQEQMQTKRKPGRPKKEEAAA